MEIEISKIQCVWQVWVDGGKTTITCQSRDQAERVAIKLTLLTVGQMDKGEL